MKLVSIVLLATLGLANAAGILLPRDAESAPEPVELEARQIGSFCTVTGQGRLNGRGQCREATQCFGVSVPGFCPGTGDSVQCCRLVPCDAPFGNEFCQNTYKPCPNGAYRRELCPGNSGVRCCVNG